jgi:hypothetical protein
MLDEIINYVQSLQNQVEVILILNLINSSLVTNTLFKKGFITMMFLSFYQFLSMKLASVNPMIYDFGMDLDGLMVRPEV